MKISNAEIEYFVKLGLAGQDELASLIMRELASRTYSAMPDEEFVRLAVGVLQGHVNDYATLLADSSLASYLAAQAKIAKRYLPKEQKALDRITSWKGSPAWLPIVESAVIDLSRRQVFNRSAFDKLDAETRKNAFTVAYQRTKKSIDNIRTSLVDAVAEGKNYRHWMTTLAVGIEDSHLGAAHGENVYRTNISKATNRGMEKILTDPLVGSAFPFVLNLYVPDTRLSELCYKFSKSGLNGTAIFLRDDPVWIDFAPPRHWNCRCKAIYLTVKQAADRGVTYAKDWLERGTRPIRNGWVKNPGLELPRGWVSSSLV